MPTVNELKIKKDTKIGRLAEDPNSELASTIQYVDQRSTVFSPVEKKNSV